MGCGMLRQIDFRDKCCDFAIIITFFVIIMIVRIFADGGIQQMEYLFYKLNQNQYQIVSAQIVQQEDVGSEVLGWSIIPIIETKVKYKLGDTEYSRIMYSYAEMKEVRIISIAVKLDDHTHTLRCTPWKIQNWKDIIVNWGILVLLLIALINNERVMNLFRRRQKKKTEQILVTEQRQKDQLKDLEDQIKKEKLLAHLKSKKEINEETFEKVKIMMGENNIHWNEDWFWCFRILHSSQIMFLCENMENPAFITKTLEMRKKGLPDDYYIIDQKNGYYLCCRYKYKRIFSFSMNLGITNTIYEDIYDYILAQTDSVKL